MKPRVCAIIQARMGSQRFPGKMAAPLGEHSVLEWLLNRVRQAKKLDAIIVATTEKPIDDPLVQLVQRHKTDVIRGSEDNVLSRFVMASRHINADVVVRICADNPFIDPVELDRLVSFYLENRCDYACNHQARLESQYADGFGAEILSAPLLYQLDQIATEQPHREHVTLYLWDHINEYNLRAVPSPPELAFPDLRFDVDTPSDLERLKTYVDKGVTLTTPAPEIIEIARNINP